MTCRHAKSLLEDYIDGDLAPHQCAEVDSHLDICEECRGEFRQAQRLKESLENQPSFDPGEDYWRETTEMILARTEVSVPTSASREKPRSYQAIGQLALVRAAVSFAVSLGVLMSAIVIGSRHPDSVADSVIIEYPFVITASIRNDVGASNNEVLLAAESSRLARGTLLFGAPGMVGKGIAFKELMASTK
jgi:hypothetical protein